MTDLFEAILTKYWSATATITAFVIASLFAWWQLNNKVSTIAKLVEKNDTSIKEIVDADYARRIASLETEVKAIAASQTDIRVKLTEIDTNIKWLMSQFRMK